MRGGRTISAAASLTLGVLLLLIASVAVATERPADCLDCHRASAEKPVLAVFHTRHGRLGEGGNDACVACHGPSEAHRARPLEAAPEISYGPRWQASDASREQTCLTCHGGSERTLWQGSAHQSADLACGSCHTIHSQKTLRPAARTTSEGCLDCHQRIRGELRLPSRHPIAEGKTACTDCHNPHGGSARADLHQVSVNDNCLQCHDEMRGPFLWEHPPVSEDCTLCHRAHGSLHPRLLRTRGPALCQQCHAAAFHPSLPYGGSGLPGRTPDPNLLGKNCLNCHNQVHGSNHPGGARLTR